MPTPESRYARDVKLGGRYLTRKDVLLEPVPGVRGKPRGFSPRLTRNEKREISFFLVVNGQVDTKKMYPIAEGYELKVVSEPKTLLAVCEEAGCFLVEYVNYYRASYRGRDIFRVFRSGFLGWSEDPGFPWLKEFMEWRSVKPNNYPFRVSYKKLLKAGKGDLILKTIEASV